MYYLPLSERQVWAVPTTLKSYGINKVTVFMDMKQPALFADVTSHKYTVQINSIMVFTEAFCQLFFGFDFFQICHAKCVLKIHTGF